jgi:hypothetical protein
MTCRVTSVTSTLEDLLGPVWPRSRARAEVAPVASSATVAV